jgi:ATP-binding cassette subfamily F protein uup
MLAAYDGTVMIASHDRAFLDGVTTQIVGALGNGRWVETTGGYSDFEREHGGYKQDSARREKAAPPSAAPPRVQRKLSYKDERRLTELETRLPALDAEIAALEAKLADPALFTNDAKAFAATAARLDAARVEKDASETEWLELEERRAALSGASSP